MKKKRGSNGFVQALEKKFSSEFIARRAKTEKEE